MSRMQSIKSSISVTAAGIPRVRVGIRARLLTVVVSVAVLALAANFIVEQGVLIERTTRITTTVTQKPPAAHIDTRLGNTSGTSPGLPEKQVVTSDLAHTAIAEYSRSVLERVAAKTTKTDADYHRASNDLEHNVADFVVRAGAIRGQSFAGLKQAAAQWRLLGERMVALSDARDGTQADYTRVFEDLYAGVNDSLASSWKVFGRIVARQSLVQLGVELDSLRRMAPALHTATDTGAPEVARLIAGESAITDNLNANERSFRHGQSDQWYESTRSGFAQLVKLRSSLLDLNGKLRDASTDFNRHTAALSALLPNKVKGPASDTGGSPSVVTRSSKSVNAANATVTARVASREHLSGDADTLAAPVGLPAPIVQTNSTTTRSPQDQHRRRLIAVISVAVLLLSGFLSVATAVSIVRPVRRLHDATERLAKGEPAVQVARGGIGELDKLAVAFNQMALELTAARTASLHYQDDLEHKVSERTQQLQELAERDPLTGLANRRKFLVQLDEMLASARTDAHRVGVFFLDLDNFKYLNDTMGHAFGDRVLEKLATRLHEATLSTGFAARFGGDEFTVVFERAKTVEQIRQAGLEIVQAFHRPLYVDGRDLIVSVSVGASIFPDHEQDAEALLKAADAALFRAKALGRSQLAMFTPELLEAAKSKFTTEQALRRSIERGEFELVFQPEVDAKTLQTKLVEALIRWRMPDGELAAPDQFLAVAEESGLIMEIGDWALHSAIEAASGWHHGAWPDARVAINVSPRQLLDSRFVGRLADLLVEYRLPPRCIEIELTESVLQTGAATLAALHRLHASGIAIALDDFGTGYSSLASLEHLPLTRIKLDRSLIAAIDTSPRSAAIARAIIVMCQGLDLEITAEGVERVEQLVFLRKSPGITLQGYLLSRPVAHGDVLSAISQTSRLAQSLMTELASLERTEQVALSPGATVNMLETG